ncbi:hypothetical protein NUM3379_21920 [Kineococcus sp. NUM-3379]
MAAAWRAVPLARRLEIARAAKRGVRHPDEAAVRAAQSYARLVLSPGPRWIQRPRVRHVSAWLLFPLAGVLVLEAVLLVLLGAGPPVVWAVSALAVITALVGWFWVDLLRDCRRLLALGDPEGPPVP